MKQSELALINYLKEKKTWIGASDLARHFNLSTRTLRRYITNINSEHEFIESSKEGYRMSYKGINYDFSSVLSSSDPLRRRKDILRLLLSGSSPINIYDLSESLYISESTLLADVSYIRKYLVENSNFIKVKNNNLFIDAPEASRRRIISNLFYEESNDNFFDIGFIQKNLDSEHVEVIKSIIKTTLDDNEIILNEYTLNSILIHLSISIGRIEDKYYIESDSGEKAVDEKEFKVALEIISKIQTSLEINIPVDETYYLAALLASKTYNIDYKINNLLDLTKYIDLKYFELTRKILARVYEVHLVDLNDNEFIVKFTVHLRNLIKRLRFGTKIQNPLTANIKESYPMIYNLAVFIAYEIEGDCGFQVSEDEITYLAFHIGAFFERKKKQENTISTVIISPDYYGMHTDLIKRIKLEFGHTLDIMHVFTDVNTYIQTMDVDFILSTVPLKFDKPFLQISPFLKDEDVSRIFNKIIEIRNCRNTQRVKDYLLNYLNEEFFEVSEVKIDRDSAIDYIANKFVVEELIDADYVENIFVRERLSSTAFRGNIAMPHALKPTATKSNLSIYINKPGIEWDSDNHVHLVVMFVLSKEDAYSFNNVFDGLIELLTNPKFVHQLIDVDTFDEFKSILKKL